MSPGTISSTTDTRYPEELFAYETLCYAGCLEFLDANGDVAVFRRRQTIRVTARRLTVFLDRIWGEGVLFADYWTAGLPIVEAARNRSGWVAILGLRRTYRKGEVVEIRTERRIVGGFTQQLEHWDSTMFAPTKWLSLEISGAAAGRLRWPNLLAPAGDNVVVDQDGKALSLIVREPVAHAPYRLQWNW
ncbi:MAG: hypothetical protein E6J43_13040 [Chloroflexi bacterium]|nr:MAG: hypothetical protein E6J43_13040 [Chloroflexota bacterium]